MTDTPVECPSPHVTDGQGLSCRITASLLGCKGETRWAHTNSGGGGDGEGDEDGDGDRRGSRSREGDGRALSAD